MCWQSVGNTLVYMYCKEDAVKEAQEIFGTLLDPDAMSWTVLIEG